jgi:hypothetical protein
MIGLPQMERELESPRPAVNLRYYLLIADLFVSIFSLHACILFEHNCRRVACLILELAP